MVKIAIFAGHGGSDPGAIGVSGRREKDLNLAVSNAVTSILRGLGYTVTNNRTTDVDRSITRDANLANSERAEALVEIHMNSNSGTPGTGSEAFVSIRDSGRARTLADAILRRMAGLGFANRGVKTSVNSAGQDNFAILRLTNMPAVLLEVAFINNPNDMARFDVNNIARAIAEGIREALPLGSSGNVGSAGLPSYPGTLLRVGSRGDSVAQVQACLNRAIGAGLSVDGIFGPRTFEAVTNFQRRFGLVTDGIVGPITWGRLSQECGGVRAVVENTPQNISQVSNDSSESMSNLIKILMYSQLLRGY
ncbi:MAG: N-acetylmuramoyl-L-alanine amidase [Defluviitaleaceae bacterium]|nr:N-acetylmuramoyl-L-alanine amidase [Defluviitaleaceae bacterium]